ncbi:hypothetical protein GCM10023115_07540 [Pontixanthobacter gangjinensis]
MPRDRIERALVGAPGLAQPSRVVATELEFARAAKTDGLASASLDFAGPNAVLHGRNGPVPARLALAASGTAGDAGTGAVDWSPRAVVMSCDGSLAVSQGRFREPSGVVGNYVTVWQRVNDTEYRWIYDVAGPDVPQPPPRNLSDAPEGIITVEALDSVQGFVAICPRAGQGLTRPPEVTAIGQQPRGEITSRDGTLRWRWEHRADGTKYIAADYFTAAGWETAIEEGLSSPLEDD